MQNKIAYQGSKICFGTSFLFSLMGMSTLATAPYQGMGMLLTSVTSMLYHYKGGKMLRKIDFTVNVTLGSYFTVVAIQNGKWLVPGFALLTLTGYYVTKKYPLLPPDVMHSLCVHVPTLCGFAFV